jgi:hypothetical protein
MGWGMLPTYVGPQAPCWGYQGVTINPKHAAADGRAAGADAVLDARLFGLPAGSPIYYDMEAYNTTHWRICVPAVLTFRGQHPGAARRDPALAVYEAQQAVRRQRQRDHRKDQA